MASEGARTAFIHTEPRSGADGLLPGPIERWTGGSEALFQCLTRIGADWLWLQFSGYGYSRWGAPYTLARVLGRLRRRLPNLRIAICLHETHCRPKQLGRKGWWLSPWQRHVIARVARSGDLVFTSIPLYQYRAVREYGVAAEKVLLLPIGSNVPPADLTPEQRAGVRRRFSWEQEERVAVTFGTYASQLRALRQFTPLLVEGLRQGELQRVVSLGGEGAEIPRELATWAERFPQPERFAVLGPRSARDVSDILASCDFAFAAIHRTALGKSGSFLAYAFAGLAVLVYPTDLYGNFPAEPLPVLAAETWDWQETGSARVAALRQALREHAERIYRWDRIARKALGHLGAPALTRGRLPLGEAVTAPGALYRPLAPTQTS
jgi:hypothetical protein